MCISSFFDIISQNVTECAKKSILASKFDGSYFARRAETHNCMEGVSRKSQ